MALTLTTLRARALDRVATHAGDTYYTTTRLDLAINAALQQITSEFDWPWLQTSLSFPLVNGVSSYALGATFLRLKSVTLSDIGQPLQQRSISEIDQIIASVTGVPNVYAIFSGNLEVRPTPSAANTLLIRFYQVEPILVNPSDTALIPENYSDGVLDYVAYLLYRGRKEPDKSAEAFTGYRLWVKRTQDNVRQSKEPTRIIVRPGSLF